MKKQAKKAVLAALAATAFLTAPSFAQKATIAVGSIEYRAMDSSENKQYRAFAGDVREDVRAFGDMVTTALVKTNRFNVVERDRMAEILEEQGLSLEGVAAGGFEGDGFNLQGVDYIMTGAITEYGTRAKTSNFGRFSGGSETVMMSVDVRVLEVATGAIGFADTVSAEVSKGGTFQIEGLASTTGKDSSGALGEVMRRTAQNVTNAVVTSIYPIKVVGVQATGEVMLNYGVGLLSGGEVLEAFSQGEVFVDPDTGEELGREEELVGKLSVTSVQPRFSKANIIDGQGIERGMLARITNQALESKGRTKEKRKRRKLF